MSGQDMWDAAIRMAEAIHKHRQIAAEEKKQRAAEKRARRAAFRKAHPIKRAPKPKPLPEYEPTMRELFERGCYCSTTYPPCGWCTGDYGRPEDYADEDAE